MQVGYRARHAPAMQRRFALALVATLSLAGCITPRPKVADCLSPLWREASPALQAVVARASEHRLQILISEPATNAVGKVTLRRHGYRVGAEYFYPASAVKLCAAVAALQELERLRQQFHTPDLLEVPLQIAPLFPGDFSQAADAGNRHGGHITVGQELRKIAYVSDNQAFNRLYDLIGHANLNRRMHALGLNSVCLNHRLSETRSIQNMRASAAVTLHPPGAGVIRIPARHSPRQLTNAAPRLRIGTGYLQNGDRVSEPLDFTRRNGIALVDLQDLLVKVVRPDIGLGTPKLKLKPAHRAELIRAMTEYPREAKNPIYDAKQHPDASSKFMLPGLRRVFSQTTPGQRVEVTGKPGRAYGFSIDNSYVRAPGPGSQSVFVTVVLYTNTDGILNDDRYDYETVADPFLADLGELIARHWLTSPGTP